MPRPIIDLIAILRRLAGRREGNIAILFGLSAIPLIVGAGIAIDAARAYTVKERLEAALDASALAVGSSTSLTSAQLQTRLQNYFAANYPLNSSYANAAIPTNNISVSMTDPTQPVVTVTASATVPMTILELVGITSIHVSASNQITKGTNALELALVLDNTGSMMCGDGFTGTGNPCPTPAHMAALTSNAQTMVDTLFADSVDPTKLKIAIVPYVTSVNIGSALCGSSTTCGGMVATDCNGDFVTDNANTIYDPSRAITPPSATYTGKTTRNSTTITGVSPTPTDVYPGMTIAGTDIPSGATVTAVSGTQITISSAATGSKTGDTLTISGIVGYWSANSNTVTVVYPPLSQITGLQAGIAVTGGTGGTTAPNANIIGVANPNGNISYAPAWSAQTVNKSQNQITLCQNQLMSQANGSASNPVPLTFYQPVTYNTSASATTTNWNGCVVEPTLTNEDANGNGPDFTEPTGGWTPATMGSPWWAFYWTNGGSSSYSASNNTWYVPGSGASVVYDYIAGNVITATDSSYGPNLSCPIPMVRLTNTQSTLDATMQAMTAEDNSGTAIAVGMIWGWRALSPNPPFSDGQPYGTPALIKAVVLETDGQAEVAGNTQGDTTDFTGYGYISEGKLGSTTSGLYEPYGAPTNPSANYFLNARLTDVCTNMKNAGIVIYTIGLGSIGASNTQLESCASGPSYWFPAPTSASLQTAFQQIAISLNSLRLSQ